MRMLAASLVKELRRTSRDPLALALWLGIPFSILMLMNLAFGGRGSAGPRPQGIILVADLDDTLVSRMVGSAFTQGPLGDLFRSEKSAEPDGRARMARGEATALIIVPRGFQDRVLRNEKVALRLVTNPTQRILPAIAAETLRMLSEGVHYLHLVAGDQIRPLADSTGAPTDAQVVAASLAINQLIRSIERYLKPLALEVVVQSAPKKEQPPFNLLLYLFPGMLFMSVLFLTRGMSDDLWEEVRGGTWRRLRVAGASVATLLGAKLLAVLCVTVPIGLLALAAGHWWAGIGVANWTAALVWIGAGAAVWYLIMLELQVLAGAEQRGEILTSFVLFPSMMLGGSMFAFAMMPDALAKIGKATPLGWMVVRFDAILRGQATAEQVALWLALLAGAAAALFAFTAWHVGRRFLRG